MRGNSNIQPNNPKTKWCQHMRQQNALFYNMNLRKDKNLNQEIEFVLE